MTIEFAKLGLPLKDKTQQVYLRYQYKNVYTGENKYEYIPTEKFLSLADMESLLADRLGGKIYVELVKFKEAKELLIDEYKKSTGNYPSKTWVMKRQDVEKKTVANYFEAYKTDRITKIKESSKVTQQSMLEKILESFARIQEEDKKNYVADVKIFSAEATTKRFEKYLVTEKTANGYIRPIMLLLIRVQNFIRKELGLEDIDYSLKHLKTKYKKYMLGRDEIKFLLDFKTIKPKFLVTQELIFLNSLIGLRIEELLGIEVSDVHFKKDYFTIYLGETKKGLVRNVPIDYKGNEQLVKLIKNRIEKIKEGKLFPNLNRDKVNYRLKTIAELTGHFDEKILIGKNVGVEMINERKHKYELISTHSFRKFAVTTNAKKHGLLIASFYSGHEDLQTMKKHYLDDLTTEDVLIEIRSKK